MKKQGLALIETVRQPEYTGENRCLPCTIMNTAISIVLAGIAALLATFGVGAAVFIICMAAIYFRGYLVPGTPTLTKRYLPKRIHRVLGTHHPDVTAGSQSTDRAVDSEERTRKTSGGGGNQAGMEIGEALRQERVVTDCPDEDDLCLDPSFREAWRSKITGLREREMGVERLAAHLDIDPANLTLEERSQEYAVVYQGDRVDAWPSRAAFLADMTVEPTLSEWCSDWEGFEPMTRTRMIASLRAFLERCPACDTALEADESAWESCCTEMTDVSISCGNCGDVVFSGRY